MSLVEKETLKTIYECNLSDFGLKRAKKWQVNMTASTKCGQAYFLILGARQLLERLAWHRIGIYRPILTGKYHCYFKNIVKKIDICPWPWHPSTQFCFGKLVNVWNFKSLRTFLNLNFYRNRIARSRWKHRSTVCTVGTRMIELGGDCSRFFHRFFWFL